MLFEMSRDNAAEYLFQYLNHLFFYLQMVNTQIDSLHLLLPNIRYRQFGDWSNPSPKQEKIAYIFSWLACSVKLLHHRLYKLYDDYTFYSLLSLNVLQTIQGTNDGIC